ncbi:MAG: Fic family protein [Mongoliitalea sp.]
MRYIYHNPDWPSFYWNHEEIIQQLSTVRNLQGRLLGKMESLGFDLKNEALLHTLTLDVLKSSEIEGEYLDLDQVRSSLARKLGMEIAGAVESDRFVDGVVEMMVDATSNCFESLTKERLLDWHAALFPTGRSGMYKIRVADWRQDSTGPMQVVSGALGKEKVYFQAPDSTLIEAEMSQFLEWFNSHESIEPVLKAAIAHLWFVTIHPFEDGNGRITRALTDLLLARSDNSNQRFYSMSAQIRKERKGYYEILEKTQKDTLDITEWIQWFLSCLTNALKATDQGLDAVLFKANFWRKHTHTVLNERQRKLLNMLMGEFEGKLTSSKWAKITKSSKDTAIRDINDLLEKGILQKEAAGGRSTNYELIRKV